MTVSIRTSTGGPLLKSKVTPLAVKKDACFVVVMRNMRPGATHGDWQPISRDGFVVVAASKLEACELVYMIGARHFPRPNGLDRNDDHDEERYLDWLLTNHLKIEPYHAGGPLEMMFSEFVKGWYPGAEDIPGVLGEVKGAEMVERALRWRWSGR